MLFKLKIRSAFAAPSKDFLSILVLLFGSLKRHWPPIVPMQLVLEGFAVRDIQYLVSKMDSATRRFVSIVPSTNRDNAQKVSIIAPSPIQRLLF